MENVGDPDIEELKQIVQRQGEVIAETNRMVHSMRRGQRLRTLGHLVWWLLIVGATVASWYYLQPYFDQLWANYQHLQQQAAKAQTFQGQVGQWFHQFTGGSTTAQ